MSVCQFWTDKTDWILDATDGEKCGVQNHQKGSKFDTTQIQMMF